MQSAQQNPPATHNRLVRLPEVMSVTGLGRSSIYELEAKGKFPKRIALTPRASAWSWNEVLEWVDARIRDREQSAKARSEVGLRLVQARTAAAAAAAARGAASKAPRRAPQARTAPTAAG